MERKWAEGELCSHPARLRFWEMDPRDKPEDDRATTIATTSQAELGNGSLVDK